MQLDWETSSLDGVRLIAGRLSNDAPVDRRVRLENQLDGPVLPPRVDGVPEAGWDESGYETVVPAGERVAFGYACPTQSPESPVDPPSTESSPTESTATESSPPESPPTDPPVELVATDRATTGDADEDTPTSASAVVRRFGVARPPRDAVPARQFAAESVGAMSDDDATSDDDGVTPDDDGETSTDGVTSDAVSAWFSAVERRVDRAERLTAPSVATATETLAAAGGLDRIDDLQPRVDADAAQLRTVAEQAESLADRAEATDVSLDALRRLA